MKTTTRLTLAICMFLFANQLFGQQEGGQKYQVQTRDGNEFVGLIVFEDEDEIRLLTEAFGEIRVLRSNILRVRKIEEDNIREGLLWPDNPQSTRYFWAPNGYGLEKGESYYQNILVLYNQATFGLTNNFSLSAGMIPLFLFRAGITPVWVVPKFSIPLEKDKINLGAGAFVGALLGEQQSFGILFGALTLGSRDKNISFSMGWGYAGSDWANAPLINVGVLLRAGPKGYFISENYFIPLGGSTGVILSAGGRSIIRNVGLDYGLFVPIADGEIFGIPFLGVSIPFGKKDKVN
ncbi:MAG: hypothetical protein V2I46_00240 [Bacteroides sp.]|nr:hypothetical protein [Bacteroides sp.]